MVRAYLTKPVFTESCIDIAKIMAIQKRTSFVLIKNKRVVRNIGFKFFAEISADSFVVIGSIGVNINFPADTAAVAASGRYAIKGLVIIGKSV